jgi:hypothetical protein
MNKNFLQKLKTLAKKNKVVSIFSNRNNPDIWSSGFIKSITKEDIILKHISPNGEYDGFLARRLDNIYRVDFDGIYEQRLVKLYKLRKQNHNNSFIEKENSTDDLFLELLEVAKNSNFVVTISIDETGLQENIIGFVKEINEDRMVVISKVSFEGFYDGEATFYLDDIVLINCDTSDEVPYKLLFKNN